MNTAKELAFEAYCHNNTDGLCAPPGQKEIVLKERFENWWSRYYHGNNYDSGLNPTHNVYVDGKRYIQAE